VLLRVALQGLDAVQLLFQCIRHVHLCYLHLLNFFIESADVLRELTLDQIQILCETLAHLHQLLPHVLAQGIQVVSLRIQCVCDPVDLVNRSLLLVKQTVHFVHALIKAGLDSRHILLGLSELVVDFFENLGTLLFDAMNVLQRVEPVIQEVRPLIELVELSSLMIHLLYHRGQEVVHHLPHLSFQCEQVKFWCQQGIYMKDYEFEWAS